MAEVILGGKRLRLDPTKAFGKGGEADVFDLGDGRALKLFKGPDHPDLAQSPDDRRAAVERIATHQTKLRTFPAGMPPHVVVPGELATDRAGKVVGYAMPLLKGVEVLMMYAQPSFRAKIAASAVLPALRDLRRTVEALHALGVVVGDFNDLNVLVRDDDAFLIDADSFQFGSFLCRTYVTTFVDPLACDATAASPMLTKQHSPLTDWYAFTVMVMQSLLLVGPYGGVHAPVDPKRRVPHAARPLRRVTVFDPEVKYPKAAIPLDRLPDDLLHHFQQVFQRDARGPFPAGLLDRLRWTRCACGLEHARAACPVCARQAPAAVVATTAVRGTVTATTQLRTSGTILTSAVRAGKLHVLLAEGGELRRLVFDGGLRPITTSFGHFQPEPTMRFRLGSAVVHLGKGAEVFTLGPGAPARMAVDVAGHLPLFDANEKHLFWVRGGTLYRDGDLGQERIGDVLEGRTLFWVGERRGFGFYRAGELTRAFLFSDAPRSLNDAIVPPPMRGKLVDAHALFGPDHVWFFTTTQEGSRVVNRCTLLRADGTTEARAEAEQGDGSWLGQIHGAVAMGPALFVPTDDGVVLVRAVADQLTVARTYPDTEPFVNATYRLHLLPDHSLCVVTDTTVTRLVIA